MIQDSILQHIEFDVPEQFQQKKLIDIVRQGEEKDIIKLRFAHLYLSEEGFTQLFKGKWENLTEIHLLHYNQDSVQIGNKGCKYLTKTYLPNIQGIALNDQNIDANGSLHLSKGKWDKMKNLALHDNRLGSDSFQHLFRGSWTLKGLYFTFQCFNYHELKYITILTSTNQRLKSNIHFQYRLSH